MGLGKTVLTIAAIEELIALGEIGGGLLIMPAALKYQWARQIAAFTDGAANVVVVDGPPKVRLRAYEAIMRGEVEYAILNYDQVVNDWDYVRHLPRDFIVLDEATAIKNFKPRRSKLIKRMPARYRWALTGQPIENKAEEVFSIMQWVDARVLGPFDIFDMVFIRRNRWGVVSRYENLPTLHKALQGAMVRHTRAEVADQMPAVVEECIIVDFDAAGARLYRIIANDLIDLLGRIRGNQFDVNAHYTGSEGGFSIERGAVMSRLACLRMLCDHPALLKLSAASFDGTLRDGEIGMSAGSAYASDLAAGTALDKATVSPKLEATIAEIASILEASPKNKIVLFSFFKASLRIIAERTAALCNSVSFTGDLNAREKDAAKQRFGSDPDVRLFLSSDAGGYGVDLPMANYLISYDLPWSAGAWDQRNARIIRLSSEFPQVTLISVLMRGSIEERQYDSLTQKQSIAAAIIDGKGHDGKGGLSMTLESLTDFLSSTDV